MYRTVGAPPHQSLSPLPPSNAHGTAMMARTTDRFQLNVMRCNNLQRCGLPEFEDMDVCAPDQITRNLDKLRLNTVNLRSWHQVGASLAPSAALCAASAPISVTCAGGPRRPPLAAALVWASGCVLAPDKPSTAISRPPLCRSCTSGARAPCQSLTTHGCVSAAAGHACNLPD
jgi:hypothetical protein